MSQFCTEIQAPRVSHTGAMRTPSTRIYYMRYNYYTDISDEHNTLEAEPSTWGGPRVPRTQSRRRSTASPA